MISLCCTAQDIKVRYVSGDCFTVHNDQGKDKFTKIVIAPLRDADAIIIKDGAKLSLINTDDGVLELVQPGRYEVADLVFTYPKEKGVLDRFYDYFHGFFSAHSSSESKQSYQNSIYAISRGVESVPHLDFPLDGDLPYVTGDLSFFWTHACEDCQYVLTVYEYQNRSAVYAETTKSTSVTIGDATKYLKAAGKYYWSVTISGVEMEYETNVFTVAAVDEYEKYLNDVEAKFSSTDDELHPTTTTIMVMGDLIDRGLINYAIYYGQSQVNRYPADDLLRDYVERYWYGALDL